MPEIQSHSLSVQHTARYYTLGALRPETREIWFVLHGYGQLAEYFLGHFEPIASESRFFVAPEALSRFYFSRDPERIGASWMTRENREAEIRDYLAYLNEVAQQTMAGANHDVSVTVLGFSQGATTASRWVTLGGLAANRLIMWAGPMARDVDLDAYASTLDRLNLTYVVGDEDILITPARAEEEKNRLERHRISYQHVPFKGGHNMDEAVIKELA